MTATPVYDQLRAELAGTPLCRVCGRVDDWNCPTNVARPGSVADGGCTDCYVAGQLEPDWRDAWEQRHCHDCGDFLDGPYVVETREVPGRQAVVVCADHFAARTGRHVVWAEHGPQVVDELPAHGDILFGPPPWPAEKLFRLRDWYYYERGEWPPAPPQPMIYDQLVAEFEASSC